MKTTVIGFIICLVLAVPSYGLSLVVFYVVKFFIDQASVEKLSAAVVSSREKKKAVVSNYANNAAIRAFFRKYGTTQTKHKHTDGVSKGMFSGYVNVRGSGEVVTTMIKNSTPVVIACYDPPTDFGSDLLSLMKKQGFHDEVVDMIVKGAAS